MKARCCAGAAAVGSCLEAGFCRLLAALTSQPCEAGVIPTSQMGKLRLKRLSKFLLVTGPSDEPGLSRSFLTGTKSPQTGQQPALCALAQAGGALGDSPHGP